MFPCAAPTLRHAKQRLLKSIEGTERGGEATRLKRGEVEEAQVGVEAFSPTQQDFDLLEGKWRLLYTTASDVVSSFSRSGCRHQPG